jgi:hypothetical protein
LGKPFSRTEDALILALVGRGAVDASLARCIRTDRVDWEYAVDTARRHAVAPLFLERALGIDVPPSIRDSLARAYRDITVRTIHDNLVYRNELSRILEAFALKGIECVLFKGLSLDHSMLRPTGDIDLLVERSRLLDAIECILGVPGYEYVEAFGNGTRRLCHAALTNGLRWRIAAQASWKHEFLVYNARRGVLVELHVTLFPSPRAGGSAADAAISEDVVQRIREGSCFNKELHCHTPRPEHSILLMSLYNSLKRSSAKNRFRLGTVVDLKTLAEGGVRWDCFVRECIQLRIAPHAYFSLCLSRRLVDAPVPRHVLTDLRESCSDVQRFLARLHLRCVRSLDSSSWLYGVLYQAFRVWALPGEWIERIIWMFGLSLFLPSRDRMATLLSTNDGSFLALIEWLLNPFRWALEAVGRRLARGRTRLRPSQRSSR